jgi:hypothetical protein
MFVNNIQYSWRIEFFMNKYSEIRTKYHRGNTSEYVLSIFSNIAIH